MSRWRWLRVAVVALVGLGLVAITYATVGRPPGWLRIVLGLAFLLALQLAWSWDEDGEPLPPGTWSVRLVDAGPAPMLVSKVLREHLRLSRRRATALVETAPVEVVTSVAEEKARRLAGALTLVRAEAVPIGPDITP